MADYTVLVSLSHDPAADVAVAFVVLQEKPGAETSSTDLGALAASLAKNRTHVRSYYTRPASPPARSGVRGSEPEPPDARADLRRPVEAALDPSSSRARRCRRDRGASRSSTSSLLERLKGACAAAQARVTDNLARARAAARPSEGACPRRRAGAWPPRSPWLGAPVPTAAPATWASRKVLVREMPHTHDLLTRGEISEWRATLVVRETAFLSLEHRQQVDDELAPELAGLGDRERPPRRAPDRLPPRPRVGDPSYPPSPRPTATSACVPRPTR